MVEVAEDFGAGPVLGGDEFSAEDALAIDDVGLGDLGGAVEGVDAGGGVADGEEVDVVLVEEALVGVGVFVHADGDDGDAGGFVLHGEEAGELFNARGAPGGPEVEDDDLAAEFAEVDGAGGVGDDELGSGAADAVGVVAAVAAGEKKYAQQEPDVDLMHDSLQFL